MMYKVEMVCEVLRPRYFESLENAIAYAGEAAYVFKTYAKIFRRESITEEWVHFIPDHFTEGNIFV